MTALRTHTVIDTPIGELTLVNTDGVLSGVYMAEHHPAPARNGFGEQVAEGVEEALTQFDANFAGRPTRFTVPLAPVGTPFQREVWE